MIAARRLANSAVASWDKALLNEASFDDLELSLINTWNSPDGVVSIYVIPNEAALTEIAMALTMLTGDGPKGAKFACVPYEALKASGLTVHPTLSTTMVASVDAMHRDVTIKKGGDLRRLIEVFLTGDVRLAAAESVGLHTLQAVENADYDFQAIALARRGKTLSDATGICGSAVTMVGNGQLSIGLAS